MGLTEAQDPNTNDAMLHNITVHWGDRHFDKPGGGFHPGDDTSVEHTYGQSGRRKIQIDAVSSNGTFQIKHTVVIP